MSEILAPVATDVFASLDVHREVDLFLAREVELNDARRHWEWADLVTEDFTYKVPVPRTPDNPYSPPYDDRVMLIDESKWSLCQQWFRRLDRDIYELSWAENPPVRFRHIVSSIRVRLTPDEDRYDVRSNVLLMGVRQSDEPRYITGERHDTIVRTPDGLRLQYRFAFLDQTVIDFPQLRMIL